MSGHSKWSTIKHKKAKTDAARGKVFTRLIKEITVAARSGGDLESNPRLRTVVLTARQANMPAANIERAIKKGTGELPGTVYEEHAYEGYGPGGAAIYIQTLTDNKNRTTGEVRHSLDKYGGNLGAYGSVSWMFERKGLITVPAAGVDPDKVFEIAAEAGADNVDTDDTELIEIQTEPNALEAVRSALEQSKFTINSAEVTMLPKNTVSLEGKPAETMLKLMSALDDLDDVQNVYSNFDIPQEMAEKEG